LGHRPRLAHQQNGRVRESGYTLKGEADPGARITLLVGSTEYTVASNHQGLWEVDVVLSAGDNVLKAKACDDAGNESPYSEELKLTLDQMPPEIEASVNPLWQRTSQPVTITTVVAETDSLYRGDPSTSLTCACATSAPSRHGAGRAGSLGRGSRRRPGHPLPGAGQPLADHLHRRVGGSLHRYRSRQRPGGKGIHPG
jgi:hypothetical protein